MFLSGDDVVLCMVRGIESIRGTKWLQVEVTSKGDIVYPYRDLCLLPPSRVRDRKTGLPVSTVGIPTIGEVRG